MKQNLKQNNPKLAETLSIKSGTKSVSEQDIKEMIENGVESLDENQLSILIDYSKELNDEMKEKKELLDKAKELLKEHAKANNWTTMKGFLYKAVIAPKSTTSVILSMTDFAKFLKKIGKLDIFDAVVKVGLTDLKKYVDPHTLEVENVTETVTETIGSITFKKV